MSKAKAKPISEIMESRQIEFGKSKVTKILKSLGEKKLIVVEGNGRGTKYRQKNILTADDIYLRLDKDNDIDRQLIESVKALGWDEVLIEDETNE